MSIRKAMLYVFIGLIALGIISFMFLKMVHLPDSERQAFSVTINGTVDIGSGNPIEHPYIYVFYPHYNPERLDQAEKITLGSIKWADGLGTYSVTFRAPIEMQVYLATNDRECNPEPVYISPAHPFQTVDIAPTNESCRDEFQVPRTKEELVSRATDIRDRIVTSIGTTSLEDSDKIDIQYDIQSIRDAMEESRTEKDPEKSTLLSLDAYWLAWRADYKMQLAALNKCVAEANNYVNNISCLTIPYETEKTLRDSNSSLVGLNGSWIRHERYEEVTSRDDAIKIAQTAYNERSRVQSELYECQRALDVVRAFSVRQEPICQSRKTAFSLLEWSQALALICLGFIIHASLWRWNKE